ncbi:MAG: AMP-binding protein, partial [Solobacterium sp.]|nr:AMP-binding protein [Solobacterium sp.]
MEEKINVISCSPLLIKEMDYLKDTKIRTLISGGDVLKSEYFENLKDTEIGVYNTYGPTEATVCATYFKVDFNTAYTSIPIGTPIANSQVFILNGDVLCGIGMPGELCIAGSGVARGYLNRPELTAERFVQNPIGEGRMYRTGDLARWLPDGNIEYLGRIDEQVKIRGFRVELGEIESRLLEISGVKDCAVISRTDVSGEKAIYAYVVSDEEINVSLIRDKLSRNLPEYMIPAYLMQIDSIPMTRNGKLDKRALPEIEAKTGNEYVAPRNETEEIICKIFGEILNVENVSIKDSFFALGGHSLRATRLVNEIEADTGTRIALKDVFSNPTPEKLAELVTEAPSAEYVPIPRAEEKEYYPMSSAQKRTYLICQMDPNSIAYNMPDNMRLTSEVRPEDLKEALQQMINRHEILRTQFLMVDGEPVQKILEHVEADFEYVMDTDTEDGKLMSDFVRPFDLSKAPLVRVQLIDRGEYHLLNIDMHHIVGDGMSSATFTRELTALYNGEKLEPLTHQFKDYSEWMRGRDLSSQAAYWKSQFEDEIPVLDMPLDFTRPQEQSHSGSTVYEMTGNTLGEKIKALASQTGTTEFMVLMSAAMILLGKYSRQEDIVIGTPISGRTHKDTEGMLGMFINTLAMRGKPEGKKTYLEFLSEMKETCLKAYENQEYP